MNPSLKYHIESNAAAVALLRDGNTCAAISALKATLKNVRSYQAAWTREAGGSSFLSNHAQSALPNNQSLTRALQTPIVKSVPILCTTARENHFDFFGKAFVIDDTTDKQVDFGTLALVLIYNIAIAMHTLCVDGGRPDHTQTVLQQYRNCLMIMEECCGDSDRECNLAVIQLAAVNNIGYIFSQHQYVLQSQEAMKWMHELLNALWRFVPVEDDAFFTVSMCMDLASFTRAPAA